jgi:asparagine synthase (glutamine-hydrolysing)
MCGISGFWGDFQRTRLALSAAALAHRGPDDSGLFFDAETSIGLAHRRLSIIDLSPAGHQPMWDATGRAVIVYNGEIYNYRELRTELEAASFSFRSNSDTEVILNLYLQAGLDLLPRLNGMFAFALWDTKARHLFVARDGQGIKPFYYSETDKGFIFASELKALLLEPAIDRALDPVAVCQYLTYMYCPAPRTMLSAVKKLEPGTAILLKDRRVVRAWRFYRLPYGSRKVELTTDEAVEAVRETVKTAVQRQMISDVPVGAFLSGGLDSSSVAAFASRFSPTRLQCFTICLRDQNESGGDGFAEDLGYARKVAAHLDVDLHTVTVGPEMALKLEEMVYFLDEPQGDPAPLNVMFIAQLARQQGIKVLLSGVGGDDIFTGYRRHYALMLEQYWSWLPALARRVLRSAARRLPTRSVGLRRIRRAFDYADLGNDARIGSYFFWLEPELARSLLAAPMRAVVEPGIVSAPLQSALNELPTTTSRLDRMLYLDGRYFLSDHNLNYTDKMAMAHGVEVRVPLLDMDLISLATRLPDPFKQNGAVGKWIFKKAMEPYLPHDVIYRSKTGFGAPVRHWMRNTLRPLVNDVLSRRALERRCLFDADAVESLVRANCRGTIDASYTVFALTCIETWCRVFLDRSTQESSTLTADCHRARMV